MRICQLIEIEIGLKLRLSLRVTYSPGDQGTRQDQDKKGKMILRPKMRSIKNWIETKTKMKIDRKRFFLNGTWESIVPVRQQDSMGT